MCLLWGSTQNRGAAVIKHMLVFQSLHLLPSLNYRFMPPPLQLQRHTLENAETTRREALTPHSTHLGPGYHGWARAGGIPWGTVRSHCTFLQKICCQRQSVGHLGELWTWWGERWMLILAGFSLSGLEYEDLRNVALLVKWLWHQGVTCSLPWHLLLLW